MSHPDAFNGLVDWPEDGPRDPEIALVGALASSGMRLAEIEEIIKEALEARLSQLGSRIPPG
ncbi:MAG TPA: hypothetical protein VD906_00080 [Caulobacteraceae bacterium]|nr:hypothetical protein [Caulobacteraceae bacterium]